jgi:hypothetical protein
MSFPLRSGVQALTLLLSCGLSSIGSAAPAPDAGLFNGYELDSTDTNITLYICGSLPGSEGCYGSGELGPFGHVGAMVESIAHTVGNVVTHNIYVVDVAAGTSGTDVVLYRYILTNTVQPPNDSISYRLVKKFPLPLTGGLDVRCSLASNAGFLFVGTDKSASVVRVAKSGYAIASFAGASNNPTVAAITADANGFVLVDFGGNADGPGAQTAFGPNGNEFSGGGGIWFTLPSNQGISTKDLPNY